MTPVKQARIDSGMSRALAAQCSGCSVSMLKLVESGLRPSIPLSLQIAETLGKDVLSLWPDLITDANRSRT